MEALFRGECGLDRAVVIVAAVVERAATAGLAFGGQLQKTDDCGHVVDAMMQGFLERRFHGNSFLGRERAGTTSGSRGKFCPDCGESNEVDTPTSVTERTNSKRNKSVGLEHSPRSWGLGNFAEPGGEAKFAVPILA